MSCLTGLDPVLHTECPRVSVALIPHSQAQMPADQPSIAQPMPSSLG